MPMLSSPLSMISLMAATDPQGRPVAKVLHRHRRAKIDADVGRQRGQHHEDVSALQVVCDPDLGNPPLSAAFARLTNSGIGMSL